MNKELIVAVVGLLAAVAVAAWKYLTTGEIFKRRDKDEDE